MDFKLKEKYIITTNDLDSYDFLKPSSILNYSQNVASKSASNLKFGFNDLIKKDLIWVVVRSYFKVYESLKELNEISVETYPLRNHLIEYPRNYIFYNEKNEKIIEGTSIWMIYSLKEKKVIIDKDMIFDDSLKPLFNERIKKLPIIKANEDNYVKDVIITQSMIDHNNHLNNSHALDFYLDVFRPSKDDIIESFQIEYVKQVYLDELISLYKIKNEKENYLYAYRKNELVFYLMVKNH